MQVVGASRRGVVVARRRRGDDVGVVGRDEPRAGRRGRRGPAGRRGRAAGRRGRRRAPRGRSRPRPAPAGARDPRSRARSRDPLGELGVAEHRVGGDDRGRVAEAREVEDRRRAAEQVAGAADGEVRHDGPAGSEGADQAGHAQADRVAGGGVQHAGHPRHDRGAVGRGGPARRVVAVEADLLDGPVPAHGRLGVRRSTRTCSGRTAATTGPVGRLGQHAPRRARRWRAVGARRREDDGAADEPGDLGSARGAVEVARGADLDEPAVAHHRDLVGQRERLVLVVGDEHRGGVGRLERPATARPVLARSEASSEENGSSSRTTAGCGASARASATRCCWPPESSCGWRSAEARAARRGRASRRRGAERRSRAGAGRRRCWRRRRGAGRARPPAGRSRPGGLRRHRAAVAGHDAVAEADGARRRASRKPATAAAASSCRSPTGRARR